MLCNTFLRGNEMGYKYQMFRLDNLTLWIQKSVNPQMFFCRAESIFQSVQR